MDTSVIIPAILLYLIICVILSQILKSKHHAFWWMLFLTPPLGAIIALLLDIRETALFNFFHLRDIKEIVLTKK